LQRFRFLRNSAGIEEIRMSYGQQVNFGYPEGVSIVDIVPQNLKAEIHPHWNNYPPVNPMWHYLLGVIYIFLGVFSFCGNGSVLYLWFKVKKLRTPSNLLITNLALLDFLMLMSQFPFFAYNCFYGGVWNFSQFFCEIYALCGFIAGLGSIWSLVFITYDRYNVIVHGVGGKPLTFGKAGAMVAYIWIIGIGSSMWPFLGWGKYTLEGILSSCSIDYLSKDFNSLSYGIFVACWSYCLPLSVIIYAYVFIVKTVVAHESAMRAQAKKMGVGSLKAGSGDGESAEMRVAKVAVFNVALWLTCWTPYALVVFQGLFGDQSVITPLLSMLPALLAKSCSTYNPMVYALGHPRYRAAMMEHVSFCCVYEPEAPADNKSTGTEAEK